MPSESTSNSETSTAPSTNEITFKTEQEAITYVKALVKQLNSEYPDRSYNFSWNKPAQGDWFVSTYWNPKQSVWVVDESGYSTIVTEEKQVWVDEVGQYQDTGYYDDSQWIYTCNGCGSEFSTVDEFNKHSSSQSSAGITTCDTYSGTRNLVWSLQEKNG